MATKIRLQRHGHKNYAFYPIVIADSRAPRDGRFIERIGSYNPNTNPATITLNFERALYWLNVGAQPTDTVRSILSREGVLLMKHLQGGVKKGAFDEAEAQRRFDAWKSNKQAAVEAIKSSVNAKKQQAAKKRLEEEQAKNNAKAEAVAKKKAEMAAAEAESAAEAATETEAAAEPAAETVTEPEVVAEAVAEDEKEAEVAVEVEPEPEATAETETKVETEPEAEASAEPSTEEAKAESAE